MDGATLNARVYAAYAKAATYIGTTYQHFRPVGSGNPLAPGNLSLRAGCRMADMMVSLNADDPKYARPNVYGQATWYAVADGAQLQVGDYIVGLEGTLFVAALQPLLPIYMVSCNRSVYVSRPTVSTAVGALGYSGLTAASETIIVGGVNALWPASILLKGRPQASLPMPAGVKQVGWLILLPASIPAALQAGDIITDDLGKTYLIEGAELTDLGWRVQSLEAHT